MSKLKIIFFFCLLLASSELYSQGGSNYSVFGFGDINKTYGAVYDGLAQTSIAFPSGHGINPTNPAMWSFSELTRMQIGYNFNQHIVKSDNQETQYQNNGKITGLNGLFMIDTTLGAAFTFGLEPYSSINYSISSPIAHPIDDDTLKGKNIFDGKGGLSKIHLGYSMHITDNLTLGAQAFALFGKADYTNTTTLFNEDTYYRVRGSKDDFEGAGFKFGAAFNWNRTLYVGAFFEKNPTLDINNETKDYTPVSISDSDLDTTYTMSYTSVVPNRFGIGLSYVIGKFIMGADFELQNYTDFTYRAGNLDFKYDNSWRVSFGIERVGNKSILADYLDRVSYRFGVGVKDLYYEINGNAIKEYYASYGMKLPLPGTAVIDASVTAGMRGTSDNALLKEYFTKLTFNFSIGETWFKPFKREY
jgi:hypothetical protein